jgi:hypothetical protein
MTMTSITKIAGKVKSEITPEEIAYWRSLNIAPRTNQVTPEAIGDVLASILQKYAPHSIPGSDFSRLKSPQLPSETKPHRRPAPPMPEVGLRRYTPGWLKDLLTVLWLRADEKGHVRATASELAKELGVSRQQFHHYLRTVTGWRRKPFRVIRSHKRDGNLYILRFDSVFLQVVNPGVLPSLGLSPKEYPRKNKNQERQTCGESCRGIYPHDFEDQNQTIDKSPTPRGIRLFYLRVRIRLKEWHFPEKSIPIILAAIGRTIRRKQDLRWSYLRRILLALTEIFVHTKKLRRLLKRILEFPFLRAVAYMTGALRNIIGGYEHGMGTQAAAENREAEAKRGVGDPSSGMEAPEMGAEDIQTRPRGVRVAEDRLRAGQGAVGQGQDEGDRKQSEGYKIAVGSLGRGDGRGEDTATDSRRGDEKDPCRGDGQGPAGLDPTMPRLSDYKSFGQFYRAFCEWERKKYGQDSQSHGTDVLDVTT